MYSMTGEKRMSYLTKAVNYIFQNKINGDFVESQAFAYLAIRSKLNLPISFPETTGCAKPVSGGLIVNNF